MTFNHLTDSSLTNIITVVGDIHINSSLSEKFEEVRLNELAKTLPKGNTLVLAGDTFDRNSPSLVDIKLFYKFIKALRTNNIYITNGNHDNTTFSFLPEINFKYVDVPTVVNKTLLIVPWTFTKQLDEHLKTNSYKELILISHARCNIPPYIKEEISIQRLSESFNQVVLGDIHTAPKLPFGGVTYTTSPSSVTFTPHKVDAHGYILINLEKAGVLFKAISIPTKILKVTESFEEAKAFLMEPRKRIFAKLRFIGEAEELRELSRVKADYVIKDFILKSNIISDEQLESSKLKEFLQSNISITDFAFSYFKDSLQIRESSLIKVKQLYEELRSKKGVHR